MKVFIKGALYEIHELVDLYDKRVEEISELKALFKRYILDVEESEGYDFINGMPEDDQIALKKIKEGK
jgi:hypothetical protein